MVQLQIESEKQGSARFGADKTRARRWGTGIHDFARVQIGSTGA